MSPRKGQLHVDAVAKRLIAASFIKEVHDADDGHCYELAGSLAYGTTAVMRARPDRADHFGWRA
ncbi:hypothetical protein GGR39_003040 [Novosphingobium fluoreni]|uniref:Uncharacterized protein n=1 Tax=Novosphingobium fluoreni TaxID=1391222 RepID=A0A7W6C482_9SPHN|nr:hypothetical protein [Novosphingobium fluoreni]MBB3941364.1 hypothetical protein [Novosphingobium fluoreni]